MKSLISVFCLLLSGYVLADPYVVGPDGNPDPDFAVNRIMSRLDGQTPRLEALRNTEYGSGVVAAGVDNGILKIFRISSGNLHVLSAYNNIPSDSRVNSIRYDHTGLYDNNIFVSIASGLDPDCLPCSDETRILSVASDGSVELIVMLEKNINSLIEFVAGNNYFQAGMYSLGTAVSKFHFLDPSYELHLLKDQLLPPGRTDIDVYGMKIDPTGRYGNKLTFIDWDYNNDHKCLIYQLYRDNSIWVCNELNTAVHTNVRKYRDLAFSNGGSFGQQLYVTELYSNGVQAVEPDGSDSQFAKGFIDIESITVSDDGEHMYVSDLNGVWHIYRKDAVTIGPEFVMREPKNPVDGVFTNANGVDSVTLLFNDLIQFSNSDVEISNETGVSVPLSVTGSGSSFMIIAFGETLLNDKYTITAKDSVVSAATGNSIDGDSDGQAGGDYVFTMEHRERHDTDNDNDIDLLDLAKLAEKWLWKK